MTKLREPNSIPDALMRMHTEIGFDLMAAEVGKSESLVRAWADPDNDATINGEQILKLDALCKRETGRTLMADAIVRSLAAIGCKPRVGCLNDAMLETMTAIGHLSHEIRKAKSPTGPGGERMTQAEQRDIREKVQVARGLLDDLDVTLQAPKLTVAE